MNRPVSIHADERMLRVERDVARAERRAALAEQREAATAAAAETVQAQLEQQALRARERSAELQAALDAMYGSASWRFSRPIRVLGRVMARLRRTPEPPPAPLLSQSQHQPPAASDPLPVLSGREQAILRRLEGRGRD